MTRVMQHNKLFLQIFSNSYMSGREYQREQTRYLRQKSILRDYNAIADLQYPTNFDVINTTNFDVIATST